MSMNARVYDTQGRIVKELGKVASDNFYTTIVKQVDLTSAINGHYVLVLDNQNKKLTKQFIKA